MCIRDRGSGLARVSDPQHTKPVEPTACGRCGAGLAGAPGDVGYRVQVFDLPAFSLEVTEYVMMRRVCGCGHPTTADLTRGVRGGGVSAPADPAHHHVFGDLERERRQVEHLNAVPDVSRGTGQTGTAPATGGRLDRLGVLGVAHPGQATTPVTPLPALLPLLLRRAGLSGRPVLAGARSIPGVLPPRPLLGPGLRLRTRAVLARRLGGVRGVTT